MSSVLPTMSGPVIEPFFKFLATRVAKVNSLLCIGLDPPIEQPSEGMIQSGEQSSGLAYCLSIVDETHQYAAAYKPNSAFFEAMGPGGMAALQTLVLYIKTLNIPVILDIKRGDIDNTAAANSLAAYSKCGADAVTLNPYMGHDAVEPFISGFYAHKAAFVLCKTSNPSSKEVQNLRLESGEAVFERIAALCDQWDAGRGSIGLVVGATDAIALRNVRQKFPSVWILCPGIGAQGGDLDRACEAGLRAGGDGLLISVSRSISSPPVGGLSRAQSAKLYRDNINNCRDRFLNSSHAINSPSTLSHKKNEFISFVLNHNVLQLGSFTLKSGRQSRYFFNAGLFCDGESLNHLSRSYARAIRESGVEFDVLFGPAYKGIPIVAAIATSWFCMYNERKDFAYSRKEAKDHGEGGTLVGARVAGRRVLIVDDVITAGTAIKETVQLLCGNENSANATIAGVVVCLDREEIQNSYRVSLSPDQLQGIGVKKNETSAQQLERELNAPVMSIICMSDIVEYVTKYDSKFDKSVFQTV